MTRIPPWRRQLRAMVRRTWRIAGQIYRQADHDDLLGMASELAFQFFLALFPFMIFLASLGAFLATLLPVQDPTAAILASLGGALPRDASQLVSEELDRVIGERSAGLLSFGILGAVFFASGGVRALSSAMNRAYSVRETRPLWRQFAVALGLTLLAGGAILLAFTLFVVGELAGTALAAGVGLAGPFAEVVAWVRLPATIALLLLAVAALYRVAPNVQVPWRRSLPGAALFVFCWLAMTWVFGAYVANFGSYARTYGTLAGVVVLLMWFYLTSVLLLIGASLTEVLDRASVRSERAAPAVRAA